MYSLVFITRILSIVIMLSFPSIIPGARKHISDLPLEVRYLFSSTIQSFILSFLRQFLSHIFQMLLMIFKYLSVNDRKALKLVCKYWFEICGLQSNDQVINCRGFYPLPDTYEFLNGVQSQLLNLTFNGVLFTDDSSFWKINGPRIQAITFEDCQFDENIFGEIIYFCENLSHLSIKFTQLCYLSFPNLGRVSGSGLVRKNLQYLEICTSRSSIPEDDLIQLFTIFPQPKVVKIANRDCHCGLIHLIIHNYLMASKDGIEKLDLRFPCTTFPMNEFHSLLTTLSDMTR